MEIVTIPSALRQHIFFSGKHPQSNPKQGLPTWPTPYVAEQGNKQTFVDVNLSATAGYEGGKMISMTGTWFLVLQCFLSHTFCLKFIFYESMFASEWKGPHLRIGLCACTCVFCLFFFLCIRHIHIWCIGGCQNSFNTQWVTNPFIVWMNANPTNLHSY